MRTLKLNDQSQIPVLGLGTWKLFGDEATFTTEKALEIGYRHLDTADVYGNHKEIAEAIKNSKLKREELFITTKVPPSDLDKNTLTQDCKRYLDELKVDYIDLLLTHWPNRAIPIEETLEAMNKLKEEGLIKAIGVSNYNIKHLEDALKTGVEVTNNQVELHTTLNQKELKEYCDEKNIVVTAYSPIGRGADIVNTTVVEIADRHHAKPSQVCLAWIMQQDIVAIPKASSEEHLKENFDSINLKLTGDDIQKMNEIAQMPRLVNPAHGDFDY